MADKITAQELIEFDKLLKSLKETNNEISKTVSLLDKLSKEFVSVSKEVKDAANSTEKLTTAKEKANSSAKKLTETEKELLKLEQLQKKAMEQTAGSYNQLNTRLQLLKNQYKGLSEEQRKTQGKAMLKDISALDTQLKSIDKTLGQHQRNVGNYGEAIKGIGSKLVGVLAIFGGATAVFNGFKKAITSTGESADAYEKALLKAETATTFFLKSLVSGNLDDFSDRLGDVITAAEEYFEIMDELEDRTRSLSVQESKYNVEIQKNLIIAADKTKSDNERKDALKEVIRLEKLLAEKRAELTKIAYDEEVKLKAEITGLTKEQVKQYVEEYDSLSKLLEAGRKYDELVSALRSGVGTGDQGKEAMKGILDEIKKLGPAAELASELTKKYGDQTKEEYDKIANAAKAYYDALSSGDERTRRAVGRMTAFEEEQNQKRTADIEKSEKKKQELYKKTQEAYKKDIEEGWESQQNMNNQISNDGEKLTNELIQQNEDLYKDIKENADEYLEGQREQAELEIEIAREKEEAIKRMQEERIAYAMDLANGLAELGQTLFDGEMMRLEEAKEKELKAAGDNAIKKEKIEKDYQKRMAAVRKKQAILDKVTGLFNIAINTAMGITNALSKIATIPLVPWIAANGAIQAAIVAAKPIPKFAKGVRNFEGGLAEVGEAGYESFRTPDGNLFMTPDKATKMILPKGTDIFTHNETKEMLSSGVSIAKFDEMVKEQKKTREILTKQKLTSTTITEGGWKKTQKTIDNEISYVNKYYRL